MQGIKEILEKIERPSNKDELVPAWWIRDNILSFVDQALAKLKEEPEQGEFTKNIRDTLRIMSNDGKFHRKVMEKACGIIEQLTDKYDRLDLYNCDMMQKYQKLQAEIKKLIEGQQARVKAGS